MLPSDSTNIENAIASIKYPNDLENLELHNIEVFGFEDEKNDIERYLAAVGKLRGATFVQASPEKLTMQMAMRCEKYAWPFSWDGPDFVRVEILCWREHYGIYRCVRTTRDRTLLKYDPLHPRSGKQFKGNFTIKPHRNPMFYVIYIGAGTWESIYKDEIRPKQRKRCAVFKYV
ncbi:hypothetical protein QAD02_007156 [Eretmocerus hayati]|uniref:Uncharacterized protein n=1 Tax=Eretmocerus hayati TaxID=131215 RepID=A0ACC2N590_9HYME|nr:hypothetical protein QAD02_007156 [Eretmocerus hayati]